MTSEFQERSFKKRNQIRCSLVRTITSIAEASHRVLMLKPGSKRRGDGAEGEKESGVWKEGPRETRPLDQKVSGP